MIAVTTYPDWAWGVYAERAIQSFLKFWPIPILVYYESPPPLSNDRMGVRSFDEVEGLSEFLEFDGPSPPAEYENHYMWDAKRFSHKVFAQLDALERYDRVIWIDADVVTHKEVPIDLCDSLTTPVLSFLGREGSYTETGIVGFNKTDPDFAEFEQRYRDQYEKREIYKQRFWTDCHAFDFARQGKGRDLTPWGRGVDNVMVNSELGKYMTHYKGNGKFSIGGNNVS